MLFRISYAEDDDYYSMLIITDSGEEDIYIFGDTDMKTIQHSLDARNYVWDEGDYFPEIESFLLEYFG